MAQFWIPKTKREIVEWLKQHNIKTLAPFSKIPKKQLLSRYIAIRSNWR